MANVIRKAVALVAVDNARRHLVSTLRDAQDEGATISELMEATGLNNYSLMRLLENN